MVTLTLSNGTFEGGSNILTVQASNGVATFSALKIDTAGTYTITATDELMPPAGPSNSSPSIKPQSAGSSSVNSRPMALQVRLSIPP